MYSSPLHDLLFHSDTVAMDPRIPLNESNCRQLGEYAKEVRDALQSAIGVIAALNSSARRSEKPTIDLEDCVTQTIEELHQCARALDEFEECADRVAELKP